MFHLFEKNSMYSSLPFSEKIALDLLGWIFTLYFWEKNK